MIKPFPLHWPVGYKRTERQERARFQTTFAQARNSVFKQLRMLGATDEIISCSLKLYGETPETKMAEKGVAVYFKLSGRDTVLCCDKWDNVADNMQAIAKTIEAMRGMDRWGCSDMLNRMFTGFEALPQSTERDPYEVLEIKASATPDQIKEAWRSLSLKYHPDRPEGNNEKFIELKTAYEKLTKGN